MLAEALLLDAATAASAAVGASDWDLHFRRRGFVGAPVVGGVGAKGASKEFRFGTICDDKLAAVDTTSSTAVQALFGLADMDRRRAEDTRRNASRRKEEGWSCSALACASTGESAKEERRAMSTSASMAGATAVEDALQAVLCTSVSSSGSNGDAEFLVLGQVLAVSSWKSSERCDFSRCRLSRQLRAHDKELSS